MPPAPGHVLPGQSIPGWPQAGHPGWALVGKVNWSEHQQNGSEGQQEDLALVCEAGWVQPPLRRGFAPWALPGHVRHGARPEILISSPPAGSTERWEAGRAQAGRAAAPAHRGRLFLPTDLPSGSWLRFWMQNGKSLHLGFRSWRLSLRGHFSSRTSREAGGCGTHGAEAQPGWWQPCWRDWEFEILMRMGWGKHTAEAVGAEVCVHGARTEPPLWVP